MLGRALGLQPFELDHIEEDERKQVERCYGVYVFIHSFVCVPDFYYYYYYYYSFQQTLLFSIVDLSRNQRDRLNERSQNKQTIKNTTQVTQRTQPI